MHKIKFISGVILCCSAVMGYAKTEISPNVIKDVGLIEETQKAIFDYASGPSGYKSAYENAMKAIALNKDPIAARLLGTMYYWGNGVTQDKDVALDFFLIAADDDAEAAYMAGMMKLSGDGVYADSEFGVDLMRQSAEMGNATAQLEMATSGIQQAVKETDPTLRLAMEKNALFYAKQCAETKKECRKILAQIFKDGLAGVKKSDSAAEEMLKLSM